MVIITCADSILEIFIQGDRITAFSRILEIKDILDIGLLKLVKTPDSRVVVFILFFFKRFDYSNFKSLWYLAF